VSEPPGTEFSPVGRWKREEEFSPQELFGFEAIQSYPA